MSGCMVLSCWLGLNHDRLEEAQAVAGIEQELFLGLCSPRHGRGGERNGICTLCRTYMKTVPAVHPCRFVSEP